MRAATAIEEIRKDRQAIIVSEVPIQVNKSRMLERIAELVREKVVEGIADLRDESDRHGVRVVIEIKRDFEAECGAEPALPSSTLAANVVRRQHARPQRRPAGTAEPEVDYRRLRRLSGKK